MKRSTSSASPTALTERIVTRLAGVPVRDMEALIALGEDAVEPLIEALEEAMDPEPPDDDPLNPLWPIVALGELKDPRAIPVLTNVIRSEAADDFHLPLAAAEALAKIGSEALPGVLELAGDPDPFRRIWAYGVLGWIPDDQAYRFLTEALKGDPELLDALAAALGDQGRVEAIPLLHEALQRAEPWQRQELQMAIQDLHWGRESGPPHEDDWRLRYRRIPALNVFPPAWPAVAVIARQGEGARNREVQPVRPLEEILADAPVDEEDEEPELCECCGVPAFQATGVPVCPATAAAAVFMQRDFLGTYRDEFGLEDLFDILDDTEEELLDLHHLEPEPRSRRGRRARDDRIDRLKFVEATCRWLVEQGVEDVGGGRAALMAQARYLAQEHGDPEGIFSGPVTSSGPEVGRNDPCPCGSGKKYKKCCGHPSSARQGPGPHSSAGSGGAPWSRGVRELRTFDDEPVSFGRAHYRMTDPAAVREALARSPDLAEDPEEGLFTWFRTIDKDERRLLGTVRLDGERLTLECMSDDRLARGKALLEELAGAHLVHRADTVQDPWQAITEARERDGLRGGASRQKKDMDPEVEAEVIQRYLERHYGTWADEALPALGGKTARQKVKTPKGREEVAELLRSMEGMEARKPAAHRFDFRKLWRELGIEELR